MLIALLRLCARTKGCPRMRRDVVTAVVRRRALHDDAVEQPTGGCIERVAPMHDGTVVPHEHVARLPAMMPREPILRRVRPKSIEQHFGPRNVEPGKIGFRAAAEIEAVASGFGMRADERVCGACALRHVERMIM